MGLLDAPTVVGLVAVINALASAIALCITTYFTARAAGRRHGVATRVGDPSEEELLDERRRTRPARPQAAEVEP